MKPAGPSGVWVILVRGVDAQSRAVSAPLGGGALGWCRAMVYAISYLLHTKTIIHRASSAGLALEAIALLKTGGATVAKVVVSSTGETISIEELRRLAKRTSSDVNGTGMSRISQPRLPGAPPRPPSAHSRPNWR